MGYYNSDKIVNYYFDMETYGDKAKVLIIFNYYYPVLEKSAKKGKPFKGESLKIFKNWESSGEKIVK